VFNVLVLKDINLDKTTINKKAGLKKDPP